MSVSHTIAKVGKHHSVVCILEPPEEGVVYEWLLNGKILQTSKHNIYNFSYVGVNDASDGYECVVQIPGQGTARTKWILTVVR